MANRFARALIRAATNCWNSGFAYFVMRESKIGNVQIELKEKYECERERGGEANGINHLSGL